MWNCLWGHALKRSPGIIRKSRVWYPGPRYLSGATWPLLTKKHYNGIIMESTCIHISEIHLLSLSKNVNGVKQLCK